MKIILIRTFIVAMTLTLFSTQSAAHEHDLWTTTTIRITGQFGPDLPDNYRDEDAEWFINYNPFQNWSNRMFSTSSTFNTLTYSQVSGGSFTDNDADLTVDYQ